MAQDNQLTEEIINSIKKDDLGVKRYIDVLLEKHPELQDFSKDEIFQIVIYDEENILTNIVYLVLEDLPYYDDTHENELDDIINGKISQALPKLITDKIMGEMKNMKTASKGNPTTEETIEYCNEKINDNNLTEEEKKGYQDIKSWLEKFVKKGNTNKVLSKIVNAKTDEEYINKLTKKEYIPLTVDTILQYLDMEIDTYDNTFNILFETNPMFDVNNISNDNVYVVMDDLILNTIDYLMAYNEEDYSIEEIDNVLTQCDNSKQIFDKVKQMMIDEYNKRTKKGSRDMDKLVKADEIDMTKKEYIPLTVDNVLKYFVMGIDTYEKVYDSFFDENPDFDGKTVSNYDLANMAYDLADLTIEYFEAYNEKPYTDDDKKKFLDMFENSTEVIDTVKHMLINQYNKEHNVVADYVNNDSEGLTVATFMDYLKNNRDIYSLILSNFVHDNPDVDVNNESTKNEEYVDLLVDVIDATVDYMKQSGVKITVEEEKKFSIDILKDSSMNMLENILDKKILEYKNEINS